MVVNNSGDSMIKLKHGTMSISFPAGESIQNDSSWIVSAIAKFDQLEEVISIDDSLDSDGFIIEEVKVINVKKKTSRKKKKIEEEHKDD